jgi:phage baseplate assembly protein W
MTYYVGFSSKNFNQVRATNIPLGVTTSAGLSVQPAPRSSKFQLTDEQLVIQDLINAFNIPQGSKPGNPEYGTSLWSMLFEPNTVDTQSQIEYEVRRIISQDPRLILNTVAITPNENSIRLDVELAILPNNVVQELTVMFDQGTNIASLA